MKMRPSVDRARSPDIEARERARELFGVAAQLSVDPDEDHFVSAIAEYVERAAEELVRCRFGDP